MATIDKYRKLSQHYAAQVKAAEQGFIQSISVHDRAIISKQVKEFQRLHKRYQTMCAKAIQLSNQVSLF